MKAGRGEHSRLGFYDHNRDINPRNQRALTLLGLLLECSLILFTLGQNPNLEHGMCSTVACVPETYNDGGLGVWHSKALLRPRISGSLDPCNP